MNPDRINTTVHYIPPHETGLKFRRQFMDVIEGNGHFEAALEQCIRQVHLYTLVSANFESMNAKKLGLCFKHIANIYRKAYRQFGNKGWQRQKIEKRQKREQEAALFVMQQKLFVKMEQLLPDMDLSDTAWVLHSFVVLQLDYNTVAKQIKAVMQRSIRALKENPMKHPMQYILVALTYYCPYIQPTEQFLVDVEAAYLLVANPNQIRKVATVFWAFGFYAEIFTPREETFKFMQEALFARMGFEGVHHNDIGLMMWSFGRYAKVYKPRGIVLQQVESISFENKAHLSPQTYANIVWAFSKLGHRPRYEWFYQMESYCFPKLEFFNAEELTLLVQGYGHYPQLYLLGAEFLKVVEITAARFINSFSSHLMTQFIMAMASFPNYEPDPLFLFKLEEFCMQRNNFFSSENRAIIWGFFKNNERLHRVSTMFKKAFYTQDTFTVATMS